MINPTPEFDYQPSGPEPFPAPPKKSHKLAWILGSLAAVLALCIGGTAIIALATDGTPTTAHKSTAPVVTLPSAEPGVQPPPTPTEAAPTEDPDQSLLDELFGDDTDPDAPVTVKGKLEFGDGVYHVGAKAADGGIPAGVYRLKTRVTKEDGCYWKKSSDPEGAKIIDNSFGSSGRLQVTLKKGVWFDSERCGIWRQQK